MRLGPDLSASPHGTDGLGHEEPSLATLEGLGGVDEDGDHLGGRPHFRIPWGSWYGSLKIQGGFLFSSPLTDSDGVCEGIPRSFAESTPSLDGTWEARIEGGLRERPRLWTSRRR